MNLERLKNLARALREADPTQFTMKRIMHACGTPACAFGTYASRRDLQDEFKLLPALTVEQDSCAWLGVISARTGKHVNYGGAEAAAHFDLDIIDLELLFDAEGCGSAETPSEAADFVDKFIQKRCLSEMIEESEKLGLYD